MDREEILLKEYEVCQRDADASARNFWTTFGFFVSFSTAIIGGMIAFGIRTQYINEIHPIWLGLILIFGIIVLIVLCFLKSWLERVNYFIGSNNRRMRDIEIELGMEKNLRVWALDKWEKLCREENKEQYETLRKKIVQNFEFISDEKKQRIANCEEPLPDDYKPPATGRKVFFRKLFYPLISIWGILVLLIFALLIYRLFN